MRAPAPTFAPSFAPRGAAAPAAEYVPAVSSSATVDAELARHGLDPERVPEHVAIIMDGNGRWAKQRGKLRLWGHHQGYRSLKGVVKAADELGIRVLTVYAFSSENWKRPKHEVEGLMTLIEEAAKKELRELHDSNVRMRFSGRKHELPDSLQQVIAYNEAVTAANTGLTFNLCVNYGGRTEIVDAVRRIAEMARRGEIQPKDITPDLISDSLYTADLPDPDLLIRTAGEMRVSNYLLWQIAYAELYVTPALWPDFDKAALVAALLDYQGRVRKFGAVV